MQPGLTTCARPAAGAQLPHGPDKTAVGKLELGLFVAELDRPWLERPFLIWGFELRHQSQSRTLIGHCRHVHVARELSRTVGGEKTPFPAGIRSMVRDTAGVGDIRQVRRWGKPPRQRQLRSRPAHVNSVPVEKGQGPARAIYDQARTDIADLLRDTTCRDCWCAVSPGSRPQNSPCSGRLTHRGG